MWISGAGDVVDMGTVMVGGSTSLNAAAGTVFALVDGPGNCVEMFRVTAGQTRYDMRVIATGAGGD